MGDRGHRLTGKKGVVIWPGKFQPALIIQNNVPAIRSDAI